GELEAGDLPLGEAVGVHRLPGILPGIEPRYLGYQGALGIDPQSGQNAPRPWPAADSGSSLSTGRSPGTRCGRTDQLASMPPDCSRGISELKISATPPPSAVALMCTTRLPRNGATRDWISRSKAPGMRRS